MIKRISISGFRGFGKTQNVDFAMPNGQIEGSGLTIITGSNNSGKTTILEAIRAFNGDDSPSFSEGRRNVETEKKISLELTNEKGEIISIKTINGGSSSTEKSPKFSMSIYSLQSRRSVPNDFDRINWDKMNYIKMGLSLHAQRTETLSYFNARIFQIEKDKEKFDILLRRVLGEDFSWCIEQRDNGYYYIKYLNHNIEHSSEGVGDGIWSVFTICAALFDAEDNSTVLIDEPELSIHPAIQKKLLKVFLEYSRKLQIVISTHSPYFISWEGIINGAKFIRVVKEATDSMCYTLSDECAQSFANIVNDIHNPHALGLEANEVFFLDDRIILVEGQEDVVIFNKIAKDLGIDLNGTFFGWGAGGAEKMEKFLKLFSDLGYKDVAIILDGDKEENKKKLEHEYSGSRYFFYSLPTDDIRDKEERNIKSKNGITTHNGRLKEEYKKDIEDLFASINKEFRK